MYCNNCKSKVLDDAKFCTECGSRIELENTIEEHALPAKNLSNLSSHIALQGSIDKKPYMLRLTGWFFLTNLAVVLSLGLISGGVLIPLTPFILLLGAIFPFVALLASKWMAKRSHNMIMLTADNIENDYERELYQLVKTISERANMQKMPEIGIYEADDMNAFATGRGRNHSMIAFSTSLLEKMDHESLAAVIAHEIAHIVNGDMIILTILQAVVNAVVLLVTIPIQAFRVVAFFSDEVSWLTYLVIGFVKFIVQAIALFIANLVIKAFSRSREYRADKLAAELVGANKMITALHKLSKETVSYEPEIKAYAALKINSPIALLDIFSTHPSLEKRIKRLQVLSDNL